MDHVKMLSDVTSSRDRFKDGMDMASRKDALACAVNSEIVTVLAVMRRNVRWGGRFTLGDDLLEHSLIQSLKALRKQIFTWRDQRQNISAILYLQPFLDVIQSDETGAPITGVALSSVYKILSLDVFDLDTIYIKDAIHSIVEAVTSCRFEVTDPASEEVVLMKILQVLLACMKSKASNVLSNQHVCTIVDTCFRVVHQAGTKSELLQRIARHTMHELIRCIFSRLLDLESLGKDLNNGENLSQQEIDRLNHRNTNTTEIDDSYLMKLPYGVPCMVQILHFLCSLLNVAEHVDTGSKTNTLAFDEDVPLFALALINSAIELGGSAFRKHPRLLSLIKDDIFRHLMQFGPSMSPLILSMVCSIVLNLYHHMRTDLKLPIEVFFSSVILRLAQSRYGASYEQQEVAMEALVDFCRQKTFVMEMFANFDCDISCTNVFEELVNMLSKSAFPVNNPLSTMNILALDGLVVVVQLMAERAGEGRIGLNSVPNLEKYAPFWMIKCNDYRDPSCWVPFVFQMRYVKRRLIIGVDHFNRGPIKGLEFLQVANLLPKEPDAESVAYFFRYIAGLDKNLIGEFLGNHDQFSIQVLHEFAQTFNFQGMSLDTALRLFLETFRLPGESQKIQRVLEAFSERYYEQSPQILANKDAALVLSYSVILLNTDQHNSQVKKKMSEEDFIRNNRCINGGKDLPREFLSDLFHSICKNEIRMIPEQSAGFPDMTSSRWLDLMHKSENAAPYILPDNKPYLDQDIFPIVAGPTIASISVVFDHAEDDFSYQTCIDGFLAVAKIAAFYHVHTVLDDLVISLCKFTTLLNHAYREEFLLSFAEDSKAKIATLAVFTIANKYGDCIRNGWRNILDCILRLHEFGLLSACIANDVTDDTILSAEPGNGKPLKNSSSIGLPKRSSGLIGRFSQLLSFESEESVSQPTEEELAARQLTFEIVQKCQINNIFLDSKFLQAESLLQLARAIMAAGQTLKGTDDEAGAVFCLELLIGITLNNRDRISLLWQGVYEHIYIIVQSTLMPCALVEKAIFGLLSICQRLLPYKENLVDDLLKSLQLVLKLDARVADTYCEQISREVGSLIKSNVTRIRSHMGWRTVLSLLAITARHLEASEAGFETLSFIMNEGAHLLPSNFSLCVDAARQFAESRVGQVERSVHALDLMSSSVTCLVRWAHETKGLMTVEEATKMCHDIGEMWLRLTQCLKRTCLDNREEVRDHAILSMQKCLTGVYEIHLPSKLCLECFNTMIFTLLDDFLEISTLQSRKDYQNMEDTLVLAIKLLSKVFLLSINELTQLTAFSELWMNVLTRMEKYMKVKIKGRKSEKLLELVPELLKTTLLVMKSEGLLIQPSASDNFWEMTWSHVMNIAPSLQAELFPDAVSDRHSLHNKDVEEANPNQAVSLATLAPIQIVASEG